MVYAGLLGRQALYPAGLYPSSIRPQWLAIALQNGLHNHAHMKRQMIWTFLLVLILTGCPSPPDRHDQVEKMADRLYTALQHQKWETALNMYGKDFYKGTSRQAWQHHLQSLQKKLGPIESFSRTFIQRHDKYYSSDVYILGYNVVFKNGKTRDSITIYQPPGDKKMYIAGHRIVEESTP